VRRFLVDAKLLPLVEKAEAGDGTSQLELLFNYGQGINGTPKDREWAKYYAYKLTEHCPKEIPLFWNKNHIMSYARLFTYIGGEHYLKREYSESIKWFKRAKNYCRSEYSDEIYESELKRHKIEEWLFKARQARKEAMISLLKKVTSNLLKRG